MMLQKAVTPGMVQAYLEHGFDRVSGWVVNAADVSDVTSAAELRDLHRLNYPGSPFADGDPIHILHFPSPPATPLVRANPEAMSELFTLPAGGRLPHGETETGLFWLEHTRLPAGARLWRFGDEEETPALAGTYNGPAFGWQDADGEFHAIPPTIMTGRVAVVDGKAFAGEPDYDEDGAPVSITLAAQKQPEAGGFEQTDAGVWAKVIAFDDADLLFESHVQATCRGLPVRVIERFNADGGDLARISSLVLDHGANRAARFDLIEAGVWEATLPWSELSDVQPTQRVAKAWARDQDLASSTRVTSQEDAERNAGAAAAAHDAEEPNAWLGGANAAQAAGAAPNVTMKADNPDDPLAREELQGIYTCIIAEVAKVAPKDAERVEIMGMCVDTNLQVASQAVLSEDRVVPFGEAVEQVAPHLIALRQATADATRGAWFTVFFAITPNGQFRISLDYDNEPRLTKEFPAEVWRAELERFPRDENNIPGWLHKKLDEDSPAE